MGMHRRFWGLHSDTVLLRSSILIYAERNIRRTFIRLFLSIRSASLCKLYILGRYSSRKWKLANAIRRTRNRRQRLDGWRRRHDIYPGWSFWRLVYIVRLCKHGLISAAHANMDTMDIAAALSLAAGRAFCA